MVDLPEVKSGIKNVKIWNKAKREVVGEIIGCVYVTKRKPFHVMRKTGGSFGISEDVLEKLEKEGAKYILFLYYGKYKKLRYLTTVEDYKNSDIIYIDNGDKQYHVRLRDMKEINGVEGWKFTVKELIEKENMKKAYGGIK